MIKMFEKIYNPKTVLSPDDLSATEKKRLYDLLMSYGASLSFAYERFFKEGFEQWELTGIDTIKLEFLDSHNLSINSSEPGAFYELLGNHRGLKAELRDRMQSLGMKSELTIIRRFTADNWRPYELRGIKAIIEEFCNAKEEEKETA